MSVFESGARIWQSGANICQSGARVWQGNYLGRVTAFGRHSARAASLKSVAALPSAYAAGLGESTRLELSG